MKKKSSLTESSLYWGVRFLAAVIRSLPYRVALGVGRTAGKALFYLDSKRRGVIYTNLKIAFGREEPPAQIRRWAKQTFAQIAMNGVDFLRLPLMNPDRVKEWVDIVGQDHITQALQEKKGCILLSLHYGSWEMGNMVGALCGYRYNVIVKPQRQMPLLDELLNSYRRASAGNRVIIRQGMGMREFIGSLKQNEVVTMIADQGGRQGLLIPFFGRQASLSTGAIRMAIKLRTPVSYVCFRRKKNHCRHEAIVHPPFHFERTGDDRKDIEVNTAKVTAMMEECIRQDPTQYLWSYKVWKYSRQSGVLIISDGKIGHLRQSEKTAQLLKSVLEERKHQVEIRTLNIRFKTEWGKKVLSILGAVMPLIDWQGRIGFLRHFLTRESYDELSSVYGDYIVSCGSSVAAINKMMTDECRAKNISVLKSGLVSRRCFDLNILPRHDHRRPVFSRRTAVTKGALNIVDQSYMETQSQKLLNRYSHLKMRSKYRIGLLIGGDTKKHFISETKIKMVLNQVKEVARQFDADILVTTSRRTSEKVEGVLNRELKHDDSCVLFINANYNNVPEAVGGILGLSDVLIVSGDSVSMVSEAASSGKKTLVFSVDRRGGLGPEDKHEQFISRLNKEGYILTSDSQGIKTSLYNLIKNKIQTRCLDDSNVIREALREKVV